MKRPNVSRRSFMKMAAATVAATGLVAGGSGALAVAAPMDDETNVTRVRSCCRACGKMECGVWVIVKNGRAIRVEGDESSFQSMGNCCTKSQASIQAAYHPDRLYYPMKRTNPKGEDDPGWVRITWDEALKTLVAKIKETQKQYGNLALFAMSGTSRLWGITARAAAGLCNIQSPVTAIGNNSAGSALCWV